MKHKTKNETMQIVRIELLVDRAKMLYETNNSSYDKGILNGLTLALSVLKNEEWRPVE